MTPQQRRRLADETRYTNREVTAFIHNAQLALADTIQNNQLLSTLELKDALVSLFASTTFPSIVVATALVSAAYDIFTGRAANGRTTDKQTEKR